MLILVAVSCLLGRVCSPAGGVRKGGFLRGNEGHTARGKEKFNAVSFNKGGLFCIIRGYRNVEEMSPVIFSPFPLSHCVEARYLVNRIP